MLKNSNVARITADYKSGICMVYMENGEIYRKTGIYRRGKLESYLRSLVKEDDLNITNKVVIELSTGGILVPGEWIRNLME